MPAIQCRCEGGGEVFHRHALRQVARGPKRPGRTEGLRGIRCRYDDNRTSRPGGHHPRQSVEFLRVPKGQVQQDQVEGLFLYPGQRLGQAAGMMRRRAIRKRRAERGFERVTE